jgi:hypothetical protein
VKSSCDKTKPDSYGKGRCVSSKEQVKCCTGDDGGPNVCGAGKYCDYSKGCQTVIQKCPSNACCKSGGQYLPQDCPSGLQCCIGSDSFVGECKKNCEIGPSSTIPPGPNPFTSFDILTGSALLGAIAIIGVVLWKYRTKIPGIKIEKIGKTAVEPKAKESGYKHCTQCGSKQKINAKFCTSCGKKLK